MLTPKLADMPDDNIPVVTNTPKAPKRNRHARAAVTPPAQEPAARPLNPLTETAIQSRINELAAEFEAGQKMLIELQNKRAELEATMLRISGAIQALRELLPTKKPDGVNESA